MSIKRVLLHSVTQANNFLGGARSTKAARLKFGRSLINFSLSRGWRIADIRDITFEQLKEYVQHLKDSGIKLANLNNNVAAIRALLAARGVNLVQTGMADSSALGLEKRDRAGTKLPVTDEIFEAAIQKAIELNEIGFVHVLRLERYLGIRGLEALMSTHQLKIFAKDALNMHEDSIGGVHIKDGTKGGRPRFVKPIRACAAETFEAIKAAVEFGDSNDGFLLQGKSEPTLKAARKRYHRLAKKVGLTGKYAPHSLRYRYASDKLIELCGDGVPLKEALREVSALLGHGFARETFVKTVYAATVVRSIPKCTSKEAIASLLVELEAMLAKLKQNPGKA